MSYKNFYGQAITELRPGCGWGLSPANELVVDPSGNILNLNWNESNTIQPPTVAEIEAKAKEAELKAIANLYKQERERLYPPLADLADAIYWQSKGDSTKMTAYVAAVEQVKADIPKT